jgi:lysophospholipase L1-like esterase
MRVLISRRFFLTVAAVLAATSAAMAAEKPSSRQWENDIRAFEATDRLHPPPQGAILFIGSSGIRMWATLAKDFPEYKVLNRGFGGCQIADCTAFADRIVIPYKPRMIVLRAGGNDIAAGKTPEQVFADFQEFVAVVRGKLPEVPIAYMSITPTPARQANAQREREANQLIEKCIRSGKNLTYIDDTAAILGPDGKPRLELFVADRLHCNRAGYELWTKLVRPHLPKAD